MIYALLATEDVEPALDDDRRVAEALVRQIRDDRPAVGLGVHAQLLDVVLRRAARALRVALAADGEDGVLAVRHGLVGPPHEQRLRRCDNAFLDYFDNSTPSKHPVFGCCRRLISTRHVSYRSHAGKVVDGMDVVTAIEGVPTDGRDKPIDAVRVESITIAE